MAGLSPELQGRLEELDRELEVRFMPANRLCLDRRGTESGGLDMLGALCPAQARTQSWSRAPPPCFAASVMRTLLTCGCFFFSVGG
jgi:hypothetical protein